MEREESQALIAALKMLSRRDFFRRELAKKLSKKGFGAATIDGILLRCAEMGYVDDTKLAFRFADLRGPSRGWGPSRIRAELMARGVDESVAIKASTLARHTFDQAIATAVRRAEARAREGWWQSGEGRARMISSLLRRGFEPDEARQAVGRLREMREAENNEIDDQPGDPEGISRLF